MSVPSNQQPTILDKLRAAERRVGELEAQVESQQQELDEERSNGERLHRALNGLQIQHRRLQNDQDELTGVSNRRLAEQRRQMLEASQESNADLRRQLEERSGDEARLRAENRRLMQQVEELQDQLQSTNDQLSIQLSKAAEQEEELNKAKETVEKCQAEVDEMKRKTRDLEGRNGMTSSTLKTLGTEESQSADAVAGATRARAAVNELRNRELQLHNSEQIMDDLLEQVHHHNANLISITEVRFVHLFEAFLKGKHLTDDARVNEEIDTFMRHFEIPHALVVQLRCELMEVAQRMRRRRRN